MSVFMDLNLSFCADKSRLRSLIETAAHLGFSTVAVNYTFEPTAKKKQEIPAPMPITDLMDQLPVVQGRSRPIRVLNRLTVVMSDSSHFRPTAPEYRRFDLLAVQPTSEKLFHVACMTLDIDIICITVTEKLPFFFKRAPINGAVERGVMFEVSYAAAIRDATMRRYTIANATSLMETCKGKSHVTTAECFLSRSSEVCCSVCLTETPKKPCPPPVDRRCCTQKPGGRRAGSLEPQRPAVSPPSSRRLHLRRVTLRPQRRPSLRTSD
ncbi:ribonuclease P protein subunit p30 isoform X3 [Xyrichtys novacula]|uniref:Ribonuclease P protein subunit p30 isoform X3 n=1 Tax=Xyrichtys novacula TaxID=13765 RepID=A0AAV1H772_XYRNO|nr:ribonuclease P protein subunit p30 isoform X3 [Xyrichtys novacula]